MSEWRKKPVVIQAEQFHPSKHPLPFQDQGVCCHGLDGWYVETLEGPLRISPNDWIIRGVKGEFYPCKPDIFEATYEPAGESAVPASTLVVVSQALAALESDATLDDRRAAFDALRDLFYPLPSPPAEPHP
jgi:hypothetical protein